MNAIRQVQALNKRELENAVPPEASWHADYRDTAYIYIGSLPYELSEGDILTIFSQYGEPVHLNLVRDKETGKSKGFAFLKYEDQRSTDLAVDNLGGASVLGRLIRVDHVRYKRGEEEGGEDNLRGGREEGVGSEGEGGGEGEEERRGGRRREEKRERQRPLLREERELQKLIDEHDEEDPMKGYLIQEKKEEVARALERVGTSRKERGDGSERERERSHRHRHHHRRHREDRSYSPDKKRSSRRERSRSRERERKYERSDRERSDRDRRDRR
ncbi:hypothetical protein FQN50_009524 [Emmonsiellopsis sp. PD_5]|nr:hypothetical protein FQN50_009524 [Emmonsiellopsis sp. PD_5]